MGLMFGISGVRGVIGETMTPQVALDVGCAYGTQLGGGRVVVGRDTRPSGPMVHHAVVSGLLSTGCDVVDIGIASTPATALMVRRLEAVGGIMITASHNPVMWNGIKFLTSEGLAPPPEEAARIKERYTSGKFARADVERVGRLDDDSSAVTTHVGAVIEGVDVAPIAARNIPVVLDSVNGAGGEEGRVLLERLGCRVVHINAEPHGRFTHAPEPLAENLTGLCEAVAKHEAAIGFAQDPDADRLAIVDEHGVCIGEEYTLALAAVRVFGSRPGPAAANLSTSRMIDALADRAGPPCVVHRCPVGEANVAAAIKRHGCVFGGEGNGGVIDPRVVPVRDSLTAMAWVLELITAGGKSVGELVADVPRYTMIKEKFECDSQRTARVLDAVRGEFANENVNDADGVRIDWEEGWVHIRGSNTEPIMRIIAEAESGSAARDLVGRVRAVVDSVE